MYNCEMNQDILKVDLNVELIGVVSTKEIGQCLSFVICCCIHKTCRMHLQSMKL